MTDKTIYIVDDEADIRESLQFLLKSYDLDTQTFENGKVFLDTVDVSLPGCLILDSRMPDLTGQQVQQLLIEQQSPLAIIYLTGHGDVPMAVDALKEGAVDFFQKPFDGQALVKSIEKALLWSHNKKLTIEHRQAFEKITKRERDIFFLVAKGYKNQQISQELFISVRTVEVHRSNLMKNLNVKTMAELMLVYADVKEP